MTHGLILSLMLFSSQLMWQYVTNIWVRALSSSVNWSCCYHYYVWLKLLYVCVYRAEELSPHSAVYLNCIELFGVFPLIALALKPSPWLFWFTLNTLINLIFSCNWTVFQWLWHWAAKGPDISLRRCSRQNQKIKKRVNIWLETGGDHATLMSAVAALYPIDM